MQHCTGVLFNNGFLGAVVSRFHLLSNQNPELSLDSVTDEGMNMEHRRKITYTENSDFLEKNTLPRTIFFTTSPSLDGLELISGIRGDRPVTN
jgi:hypothetical protein